VQILHVRSAPPPGPDRGKACLLDLGELVTLATMGGEADASLRVPPTEILAFPAGKVRTTKGNFLCDEKSMTAVLSDWQDWSGGISHKGVFDYNHDMANPDIPGYEKIAAGWFNLQARETGLWAVDINWCARCDKMIRDGEMRFWSPWFEYEPKTGRILKILNIAVTCMPATKGQAAMVAASLSVPYTVVDADPLLLSLPLEEEDGEVRAAQLAGRAAAPAAAPTPAAPTPAPAASPPAPAPRAALSSRQAPAAWAHHVIMGRETLARETLTMQYGMLYSLKCLIGIVADEMSLCLGLMEYMEESGKKGELPQLSKMCGEASKRLAYYGVQLASLAGEETTAPSEAEVSRINETVKGLSRLPEGEQKAAATALAKAAKQGWSALGAMEQLSTITGQERWDLVLSALPTLKEEVAGARELKIFTPVFAAAKQITGKGTPGEVAASLLALHSNTQRDAPILATARQLCGGAVDAEAVVKELEALGQTRVQLAQQKLDEIIEEGLGKRAGADGKLTMKIVPAQVPMMQKLGVAEARAWLDVSPPLKISQDLTPAEVPKDLQPQPQKGTETTGQGGSEGGDGTVKLTAAQRAQLPAGVSEQDVLDQALSFSTTPAAILANLNK